jgi:hypothetical protein
LYIRLRTHSTHAHTIHTLNTARIHPAVCTGTSATRPKRVETTILSSACAHQHHPRTTRLRPCLATGVMCLCEVVVIVLVVLGTRSRLQCVDSSDTRWHTHLRPCVATISTCLCTAVIVLEIRIRLQWFARSSDTQQLTIAMSVRKK